MANTGWNGRWRDETKLFAVRRTLDATSDFKKGMGGANRRPGRQMTHYYDSGDTNNPHPWYGACDMLAPSEGCAECWELRKLSLWFWADQPGWAWSDPKHAAEFHL